MIQRLFPYIQSGLLCLCSLIFLYGCQTVIRDPGYDKASLIFQNLYTREQSGHQDRVFERQIKELAPHSEFVLFIEADKLYNLGDYEKALKQIERAIQINDTHASFYNLAGLCARHLQMYSTAEDYFESGLDLEPDNLELLINLGNLALVQQELNLAAKTFQHAAHKHPASAAAFNGLAFTYFNQSKLEESRQACQQAYQLDKNDTSTIWLKAALLYASGDTKAAGQKFGVCCRMGDGECCRDQNRSYPHKVKTKAPEQRPAS